MHRGCFGPATVGCDHLQSIPPHIGFLRNLLMPRYKHDNGSIVSNGHVDY
jgi:hypothetical protein